MFITFVLNPSPKNRPTFSQIKQTYYWQNLVNKIGSPKKQSIYDLSRYFSQEEKERIETDIEMGVFNDETLKLQLLKLKKPIESKVKNLIARPKVKVVLDESADVIKLRTTSATKKRTFSMKFKELSGSIKLLKGNGSIDMGSLTARPELKVVHTKNILSESPSVVDVKNGMSAKKEKKKTNVKKEIKRMKTELVKFAKKKESSKK